MVHRVIPIGEQGWGSDVSDARLDFADPDYHLFVNLQDMLTGVELTDLLEHFRSIGSDLRRITVLCWVLGCTTEYVRGLF